PPRRSKPHHGGCPLCPESGHRATRRACPLWRRGRPSRGIYLSRPSLCPASTLYHPNESTQPTHVLLFKSRIDRNNVRRLLEALAQNLVNRLALRFRCLKHFHRHSMKGTLDRLKRPFLLWRHIHHLSALSMRGAVNALPRPAKLWRFLWRLQGDFWLRDG